MAWTEEVSCRRSNGGRMERFMTRVKVYLIVQAVLCLLLVILLSVSAVNIYREGSARKAEHPLESIYTTQDVARKAAPILPLFFIAVGMTAAGLLLGVKDEHAEKPVQDARTTRDLTAGRIAVPGADILRERGYQKRVSVLGWAAFGACMIPIALYLVNTAHFPDELEGMIRNLAVGVFPWAAAGMGCLIIREILLEKSILRETGLAKAQLAAEKEEHLQGAGKAPAGPEDGAENSGGTVSHEALAQGNGTGTKSRRTLQLVIVAAAIVFIVMGVVNGSAHDVLVKAINICTECIGLG